MPLALHPSCKSMHVRKCLGCCGFSCAVVFVAGYSKHACLPPLFTPVTVRNYKPHSSLTSDKAVPRASDCHYIDGVLIQLNGPGWPVLPVTAGSASHHYPANIQQKLLK